MSIHMKGVLVTMLCIAFSGCGGDSSGDIKTPSQANRSGLFPRELVEFTPWEGNPLFTGTGGDTWDRKIRERGFILLEGDTWHLWYTGYNDDHSDTKYLGYATSPDGIAWTRYPGNPIVDSSWIEDVFVVRQGDTWYMVAEGRNDIAHMLTSTDHIHWRDYGDLDISYTNGRRLSPGPYGTPTLWIEGDTWYLFYERNDEGIWLASSTDHRVWTNVQDDPVIVKGPGTYDSEAVALNQVIKYNGRYYAYYHGCGHQPWRDWTTNVAVSTDLIHWEKYPGNPIVDGDKSSGILVHDGARYRLYTMHPDVRVYFPADSGMVETRLIAPGAKVEKLAGGFMFTEGPACDAAGNIYFSDIPNQRIHRWSVDGTLSLFLENSGWVNGLCFDGSGNLIACLERGRALVSFDSQGNRILMAERYDNKRLNSPNDLWITPAGGIYFTDPRYRIRPDQQLIGDMEQDGEHVYYLSPDRKTLARVIDDLVRPNGIAGDPSRQRLYVIDNGANKTCRYTIKDDGTLTDKKLFASKGGDGMTIDAEGNVYLTTGGVTVFDPDGIEIMNIKVPEQTSNVCFGGRDRQTLFITAATSLYAIRMKVRGL